MKHRSVLFFAAITTTVFCTETSCMQSDVKCHNCKPSQHNQSNSSETGKVVIANFLAMFAQLLQMATNPHDKQTLVNGGMGIAQSLANIATEACKCVELGELSAQEVLSYVTNECEKANFDSTVTDALTDAIKVRYWKSALLPQETRAQYAEYAEHSDRSND